MILKSDLVVALLLIAVAGVLVLRNAADHPATTGRSTSMLTKNPRAPIDMGEPIDFANAEVFLEKRSHGQLTTDRALEFVRFFPFREHFPGEELGSDEEVADHALCGFFVAWCLYQGGYEYPRDPMSGYDWAHIGVEVEVPQKGDIAIMDGHVAFYLETQESDGYPLLIGGNQQLMNKEDDTLELFTDSRETYIPTVSVMRTKPSEIIEYRRPSRR
jgi:hypothetical protein